MHANGAPDILAFEQALIAKCAHFQCRQLYPSQDDAQTAYRSLNATSAHDVRISNPRRRRIWLFLTDSIASSGSKLPEDISESPAPVATTTTVLNMRELLRFEVGSHKQ
jgi:hypothetical protein